MSSIQSDAAWLLEHWSPLELALMLAAAKREVAELRDRFEPGWRDVNLDEAEGQ